MKPLLAASLAALLLSTAFLARSADLDQQANSLLASAKFKAARASIDRDYERIIDDVITLTEIEAPPFQEEKRGKAYMEMLRQHGLDDVKMDAVGNVMGLRRGSGKGPLIVVAGHLDTVFPAGTNVKVRREGNKLLAPGIGDDTSSLSVILSMIRAMDAANYHTDADILFVGDVGEEGPGDLRGMRHLFKESEYKGKIKYFISFEPFPTGKIINGGTGSRRYKVTFSGPGGHSMGSFGLVNPAYALGWAVNEFSNLKVPGTPKTVYNVGILEGGTSVNSIPFNVAMTVDMRSNGQAELDALEKQFLDILPKAVDHENAARSTANGKITYEAKLIGDRPAGLTPESALIVRTAAAVVKAGGRTLEYEAGSTDSNIPMNLGIEAMTLGNGFESFRAHSLEEGIELNRPDDVKNISLGLATVLLLAGAR
ncbi:MAG: M20/M25/M40 family metallo-hydrolase [Pseudomonas sp.]